ncbi:MAG: hypothetical protein EOM36_07105 [Bacteroidia bacterium]|nr:hypothetical protein [Bacteroidia bacterium]
MKPGRDKKTDLEYLRNGICSILAVVEPLGGNQHCIAKDQWTAVDWTQRIKVLVDDIYPEIDVVILVMGNLNTHALSALRKYQQNSPAGKRRESR